MARFVEEEGKDARHLREKGYEAKMRHSLKYLNELREQRTTDKIGVFADSDSCEICRKQSGTVLTLNEALEKPPIPVRECQHRYGCRCTFLPVAG